ncbi:MULTISPECIES: twin-arginine translocation pathway signal [unclassified Mycolicibacterium]|uniref:twin-arginine translocation pathway signal n=1 Tax=unclassified Mycolicibacterium TaxID=2636767 RepID=UPI001309359B|nr:MULTISPECIES: twin-arginine translocation pathway signal [unclassified Mycolicibacterium]MUL81867.1 twin-arginine translocation pathway signal [Mycolicibacterium sp. CBMA 329]MUL87633.1 twin-arginine translocation pathway signal [Mycolicibacterium sp. CBMA 331]MUL99503.1 twin-arginine translocation pathway signal [Mycolicibacterium sp. CBMA 334]MUM26411.1 twin-arginine translocation pathway signal [Mycolicibacterium sp. CBMA 295]MUM37930.1 twin-arginine translocation pathway signal [Mycolic
MTTDIAEADIDSVIDESKASGISDIEAEQSPAEQDPERPQRWPRRIARRWRPIAVACVLLASAGAAAALYFASYRVDHETAGAATAVIDAASQGSVALLSYAPNSLDQDFATARSHLTGEFLTYYSQFADKFIAPAAKQKDIHAAASVVRAATVDVQSDTAEVLVFLNQATTSRDNPEPAQAASAVKVGLMKVDGSWRISSFDPI